MADLSTVARLKTFLDIEGTAYDLVLSKILTSASEFIEHYCDRTFQQTVYSNEIYDGTGSRFLFLKNYPVSSEAPFKLEVRNIISGNNWSEINSKNYLVQYDRGIIDYVFGEFYNLPSHYRVSYTAGFDFDNVETFLSDVGGADLEMACWKLCGKIFNRRKGNSDIQSESIGNYSVTFMRETMLDQQLKSILDSYKKPEIYGR